VGDRPRHLDVGDDTPRHAAEVYVSAKRGGRDGN
jgi:hypothetical protein